MGMQVSFKLSDLMERSASRDNGGSLCVQIKGTYRVAGGGADQDRPWVETWVDVFDPACDDDLAINLSLGKDEPLCWMDASADMVIAMLIRNRIPFTCA